MRVSKVDTQTFTLKELFEAGFYDIDYYQREYAWSEDDVRTLLNDLFGEFDHHWQTGTLGTRRSIDPLFLGPFVYHEEGRRRRFLVDGQQRFTTLHLLFIHLFRMAADYSDRTSADKLSRVIADYDEGRQRFRVDIAERNPALAALYEDRSYELPHAASLSLRNIVRRSQEIGEQVESRLDADNLSTFVDWMLTGVVLAGIKATSRDNGFRIFESMNDRGAQLTQVDLVKSFLLSNVGAGAEELNRQWRRMLAELTSVREDRDAPRKFLVAALTAQYAKIDDANASDEIEIDRAVNTWLRQETNHRRVGLRRAGHDYLTFVESLLSLAKHYVALWHAARTPHAENNLSAVYFNQVNGLGSQMKLILAAIRTGDQFTEAHRKAALVANYLDRLYVLRAIEFESVDARSFEPTIRGLIPVLRRCQTPDDVATSLSAEILPTSFEPILNYRMQGNNRPQVRYLLARLTAYVQEGCRKPADVRDYLGPRRTWEIEHLWPYNPSPQHTGTADPVQYRDLRSRVSALVLLPDRDNNSLNDMPFTEKISRYGRQNALVAVLEPNYRKNHPDLKDFIKTNGLESHFRGFALHDPMNKIVDSRAELYRRLCVQIWAPGTLGFSVPQRETDQPPAIPRTRRRLQTDIAKLVRAGAIAPGTKLTGNHLGTVIQASVDDEGYITIGNGKPYGNINEAARIATGKRQDGLAFWHVGNADGPTIRQMRDQAGLSRRVTAAAR